MKSFTISISEELKKEIDKFPDINISQYLKLKFENKVKELEKIK